ncbi:MAG: site-specific DNA-methyltransferase [Planctomycetota bacterium]
MGNTAAVARKSERPLDEKFEAKRLAWASSPDILETAHRLVLGDARDLRSIRGKNGVQLIVTSPPYWDLKEYRDDLDGDQLGHIAERERFLDELDRVWQACYDLLDPGGRLCIVVGDVCRSRKAHGRHVVEPLHAYLQVRCQALGFDPLAPIFWHKISNMATEVAGPGGFLGKPYEPNAIIKNDVEFILLFRKPGGYRKPSQLQRDLSMIDKEDHRRWFRQVWTDVAGESQRLHPAPYPVEIARRLIGMFSFVGDTVVDPFVGTGTTMLAAMEFHRNSLGIEIDPEYFDIARNRIGTPPLGCDFTAER